MLEINDIIFANLDELKKVFNKLLQVNKKEAKMHDVTDFITNECHDLHCSF